MRASWRRRRRRPRWWRRWREHTSGFASRAEEMAELHAEIDAEFAKISPQIDYLHLLREELPEEGIYVDELTQVGYLGRVAWPVYHPKSYITNGYQGTLGWGVATALGVKVANPDRPVLAVSGDGGFLFTATELATAVQHNIATVTVVFNDGAYGNVRRMQQQQYGNRVIATALRNPDFVKLAESFGAQGLRAESFAELRDAVRRGLDSGVPTVIDVPVGEMPSPWAFIHPGRVR
ncbi:MAG: thiamine pyrophosphate-dependent enzyme [Caldilineaceae bacterium]